MVYNMIKKLHSDSIKKVTPFSAQMFKLLGLSKVMAEYTLNKPLQQQSMKQSRSPSPSGRSPDILEICTKLAKSTKRSDIEKAIKECSKVLPRPVYNELERQMQSARAPMSAAQGSRPPPRSSRSRIRPVDTDATRLTRA